MSKFKFGKGNGFKMPGLGSKEISTPGSFRQEQGVEDVGYCLNTEQSMLPQGSSPLLAKDASFLIPDYYSTTYTGSSGGGDQKKTIVEEGESGSEDDPKDNKVVNNNNTTEKETNTTSKSTETPGIITFDQFLQDKGENTDAKDYRKRSSVTAYNKALNKLKSNPEDLKAWEKQYGKATFENFKFQSDKYNEENKTTTRKYEISFDGGKNWKQVSKKEHDEHGGAKRS